MRPVARKLGLNPGMRALILAAPPSYRKLLPRLADGPTVSSRTHGKYPLFQVFVTRVSEVRKFAQGPLRYAALNALVWISYPKKTSRMNSDLSRDIIREAMNGAGWRAVSIIAIDEVWSALRFRPVGQVSSRSKRSPI